MPGELETAGRIATAEDQYSRVARETDQEAAAPARRREAHDGANGGPARNEKRLYGLGGRAQFYAITIDSCHAPAQEPTANIPALRAVARGAADVRARGATSRG